MTVAREMAEFANRASWGALSPRAREALKLHVLDSLGCALAARDDDLPVRVRAAVDEAGGAPKCTLIGGGRSSSDRAALYNTALVRYLDFNDAYLAPGETCHPSDSLPAVLAAAQVAGTDGQTLLASLAVAYQVQCRLSDEAPLRARGFDHTTQGTCAMAAGVSRALSLDVERTANAIAIAATVSPALRVTRSGALSNWKGLASAHSAIMATHAVLLARGGVTGPPAAFEGVNGFMESVSGPFHVEWSREDLERVTATSLKRFNSEVHAQFAIEAVLELVSENDIVPSEIEQIVVGVFGVAFDIIGGGLEGDKTRVQTKEQADHSLPYLVAVAALDRQVMPAQFERERIVRADVQALLRQVVVRPDPALSGSFPREVPCEVTLLLKDGRRLARQKRDYLGFRSRPLSWDEGDRKFRTLTARIGPHRQAHLEALVSNLERIPVEDLCSALEEKT
ncbi:MAG: MmgE/PrpD family protein [Polyangiaceae bacterium]